MINKKIGLTFFLLIIGIGTFLQLRKNDLIIHFSNESYQSKLDILVSLDGAVEFDGIVIPGEYNRDKIIIKNVGVGLHSLDIKLKNQAVSYQCYSLFLLNRTTIVTYFDNSATSQVPYFDVWRKFGKYLSD